MQLTQVVPILVFLFYFFRIGWDFFVSTAGDHTSFSDKIYLVINVLIATIIAYLGSRAPGAGIRLMIDFSTLPLVFILVINGILPPLGYTLTQKLFAALHRNQQAIASWHQTRPYLKYFGYLAGSLAFHSGIVLILTRLFMDI